MRTINNVQSSSTSKMTPVFYAPYEVRLVYWGRDRRGGFCTRSFTEPWPHDEGRPTKKKVASFVSNAKARTFGGDVLLSVEVIDGEYEPMYTYADEDADRLHRAAATHY